MASMRVLVVDDDPDTRGWMSGYLAELGYEPHVALDGDHALDEPAAVPLVEAPEQQVPAEGTDQVPQPETGSA